MTTTTIRVQLSESPAEGVFQLLSQSSRLHSTVCYYQRALSYHHYSSCFVSCYSCLLRPQVFLLRKVGLAAPQACCSKPSFPSKRNRLGSGSALLSSLLI